MQNLQKQRVAKPRSDQFEVVERVQSESSSLQSSLNGIGYHTGQPLDTQTQALLEPQLGHSLEHIRIHQDVQADQMNRDLQANAFTVGPDIYFRQGLYNPNSSQGQHLLAHELTHTMQQARGPVEGNPISEGYAVSTPGDAFEREAEQNADRIMSQMSPNLSNASQARVGSSSVPANMHTGGAGRTIQRDFLDDAGAWLRSRGHDIAEGVGLETADEANLGRAEAFFDHGVYGPQEVTPNGGAFQAAYDPPRSLMNIIVRGAVNFQDGLIDTGGTITAAPGQSGLTNAAIRANTLTGSARTNFVRQYQWDPGEKSGWLNQLETSVQSAWTGQHQFHINRPQWNWIGARIDVDVQVHEGTRASNDHLAITSVKVPPTSTEVGAFVNTTTAAGSFDGVMTLSSTNVAPRPDNLLRNAAQFAHDSDVLDANSQSHLTRWIATFEGAPGNPASRSLPLKLEGHTSASGTVQYNRQLAQRRIDAVRNFLTTNGFTNVSGTIAEDAQGETGTNDTDTPAQQAQQRRVDIIAGNGNAQVVGAHEFGHAFGLGDEYAIAPAPGTAPIDPATGAPATSLISGTGNPSGTAASHDGLARNMTDASGTNLPGAIHENNDNIMSLGNVVQPQHYATFHAALVEITGVSEWALGPAGPRPTPGATTGTSGSSP